MTNSCKEGVFDSKHIDAYLQFECVEDSFSGSIVEICDADDRIEVVESSIRMMKERIRFMVNNTLFRRAPKLLVKIVVKAAT